MTIDDGHGGTVVQTITITINGAADGSTTRAPRKASRGNGSDPDDGHGAQHADGHGMDEDQIPAPQPMFGEHMTFLGAHLHSSDQLVLSKRERFASPK